MSIINELLGRKDNKLPPFRKKFDVPAIATSGWYGYTKEDTLRHYRKFLPFTFMFVRNMSSANIRVTLNNSPDIELEVVTKGESTSNTIPFWEFTIKNDSATTAIAEGEVTIWVEKT